MNVLGTLSLFSRQPGLIYSRAVRPINDRIFFFTGGGMRTFGLAIAVLLLGVTAGHATVAQTWWVNSDPVLYVKAGVVRGCTVGVAADPELGLPYWFFTTPDGIAFCKGLVPGQCATTISASATRVLLGGLGGIRVDAAIPATGEWVTESAETCEGLSGPYEAP